MFEFAFHLAEERVDTRTIGCSVTESSKDVLDTEKKVSTYTRRDCHAVREVDSVAVAKYITTKGSEGCR